MTIELTDNLAGCHAVRRAVFINEQNVSEAEELDDLDAQALHILATKDGTPVGTARLLIHDAYGKIGRVAVTKDMRGTGLGAKIMQVVLDVLRAQDGVTHAKLDAQISALKFYEKLGFIAQGPEFMDANIPHRLMVMPLSS
ncbi:GNAT family N-acetyltransferase [Aestuariibius sp. HNIBRBA575]|uniref:GNAT family N-acetyltransferase n=1 Tax=Aestuariibius sp. HNIBRBA575 TaxID=3233343 RepID=UPI0034A50091